MVFTRSMIGALKNCPNVVALAWRFAGSRVWTSKRPVQRKYDELSELGSLDKWVLCPQQFHPCIKQFGAKQWKLGANPFTENPPKIR